MAADIIIRNASLLGLIGKRDIVVSDGKVEEIRKELRRKADIELDARGGLVTSPFVDPHIHLDKCQTRQWAVLGRQTADIQIERARELKKAFKTTDIKTRASECARVGIGNGTLHMRAFVDVDTTQRLKGLEALKAVRSELGSVLNMQICAFPQEGIIKDPGTEELLYQAMEQGADVVGGIPWLESTDEEMWRHLDIVFRIAKERKADLHFLDNSADSTCRALEYTALKTVREGFQGRVTYSSATVLSYQNDYYAARVIELTKRAGITILCNAPINLINAGLKDREPQGRGITRVRELMNAGVNVACGQDDVNDPYYPFGIPDQLEVASFMAHVGHFHTQSLIESAFRMVTHNAARAMRIPGYGLKVGNKADIVVIDAPSVEEAIRRRAERLWVIAGGKLIVESKRTQRFHF